VIRQKWPRFQVFPSSLDTATQRDDDPPMSEPRRVTPFFDSGPATPGTERFDVLFERGGVVIERITSSGSQPPQSYCQSEDEFVLLLRGQAKLRVDGELVTLNAGDSLTLLAQTPHEVLSTSENALWLAVHVPRQ
jgi:cupin 2 domain-containing protein